LITKSQDADTVVAKLKEELKARGQGS
jgi:hypothetical protein